MLVLFVYIHRAFCNGARDPGASYINSIFQPITGSRLPLVALFPWHLSKELAISEMGQFCNFVMPKISNAEEFYELSRLLQISSEYEL